MLCAKTQVDSLRFSRNVVVLQFELCLIRQPLVRWKLSLISRSTAQRFQSEQPSHKRFSFLLTYYVMASLVSTLSAIIISLFAMPPFTYGLSKLDICLPPGSACLYNRDCCGGREPTNSAMTASVHCLTTCCVKTDHFGCQQDADCCSEGTVCNLEIGGQCTMSLIDTISPSDLPSFSNEDVIPMMAAEAAFLNEDDFPINKKGDKTKLIVLIVVSIMICNICCFSIHRRNKRIFFISKSQVDRIRSQMDSADDDYDSEHFEYLNEPNRISFVMSAKHRHCSKLSEVEEHAQEYEIPITPEPEPGQE